MPPVTLPSSSDSLIPVICNLGQMNQMLIHKSLNFGLLPQARELQHIERQLIRLILPHFRAMNTV
jgi:hypothetical protein